MTFTVLARFRSDYRVKNDKNMFTSTTTKLSMPETSSGWNMGRCRGDDPSTKQTKAHRAHMYTKRHVLTHKLNLDTHTHTTDCQQIRTKKRGMIWDEMRWHEIRLHMKITLLRWQQQITTSAEQLVAVLPNWLALRWHHSFIRWPVTGLHDTTEPDNTY